MVIDLANFRDPVEILEGAMAHLEAVWGEERATASTAYQMMDRLCETFSNVCIDNLISETARKNGLQCPCSRHIEYWLTEGWTVPLERKREVRVQETEEEPPRGLRRGTWDVGNERPLRDGKAAAGGEDAE